jgi:hypothetical protein
MKAIKKVSPIMGLWSQYAAIVVFVAMSTLRSKTSFATAQENNTAVPQSIFAKVGAVMSPLSSTFSNRNIRSNNTKESSLSTDTVVDTNDMNITALLNATVTILVTNTSDGFRDNAIVPVEVETAAEITTEYYSSQDTASTIQTLLDGSAIDGTDEYIQPLIALPYSPPYTPPVAACPTNSPTSAPRRTHPPIEIVVRNPRTYVPFSWPTSTPTSSHTKSPTLSPTSSPTKSPTPSPTSSPTSIPKIHPTQRPWYLPRPNFMPVGNSPHLPPKSDSSNHPPRPAPWTAPNGPAYPTFYPPRPAPWTPPAPNRPANPTQYYPVPQPTQCYLKAKPSQCYVLPQSTQCYVVPQPRCCRQPFDCSWCKFFEDRRSCDSNRCVDNRCLNGENRNRAFY